MLRRYTLEDVTAAIDGSSGIVSHVAKRLKCDWTTAKRYIENWASTRHQFHAELQRILDTAEEKLFVKVKAGNLIAIKYILSTKGKVRGYTERRELTGPEGEPIAAKFVAPERFQDPAEWEKFAKRQVQDQVPDTEEESGD
jgi:hypothetical protein